MKKSIIVFCAHPDDDVLGAGGTMAKYAEKNYEVIVVVFSYGERAHPLMKREFSTEMRVKEAKSAHRILGCKRDIFLGLKEGNFIEDIRKKKIKDLIQKMVKTHMPEKVFTHSASDPHPDHQAVHSIVLEALKNARTEVYTFDIWNPISVVKRNLPKLYVDISGTMKKKVSAIKMFKSQHKYIFYIIWSIYIKNLKAGLENRCRFAEVFCKEK